VADELRRQADHFIELQTLENIIGRASSWRDDGGDDDRGDNDRGDNGEDIDDLDDGDDDGESYADTA